MERKARHKLLAEFILRAGASKDITIKILFKGLIYERAIGKVRSTLSRVGAAFG